MENVGKSSLPSGCPFLWAEIHQVLVHRWLLNWRQQGFTNSWISRNLLLKCFKKHRQNCETEPQEQTWFFFFRFWIYNQHPITRSYENHWPCIYSCTTASIVVFLGKAYVNISSLWKNKANFYKHKRMEMKPYFKVEQFHIKTFNSWKWNKSEANS